MKKNQTASSNNFLKFKLIIKSYLLFTFVLQSLLSLFYTLKILPPQESIYPHDQNYFIFFFPFPIE